MFNIVKIRLKFFFLLNDISKDLDFHYTWLLFIFTENKFLNIVFDLNWKRNYNIRNLYWWISQGKKGQKMKKNNIVKTTYVNNEYFFNYYKLFIFNEIIIFLHIGIVYRYSIILIHQFWYLSHYSISNLWEISQFSILLNY